MKKHCTLYLCLISIMTVLSVSVTNAQDIIHRKNGKKIETKVMEISTNEVKYKDFNNLEGPIYTIEKIYVKQIVFENGKVEKFDTKFYESEDNEWHLDNRKHALKFSLFGPLRGYTELSYEKSIKLGQAYEISVGAIGLGKDRILSYDYNTQSSIYMNPKGFFVSGGFKFANMPTFFLFGKPRQKHLFHGTYIKPILYLGHYSENQIVTTNVSQTVNRQKVTFGNIQIEFGKQWEFANRILFDLYFGAGYGFDNKKYDHVDHGQQVIADYAFNYTSTRLGSSPSVSFTFGAKFGMLFNTPEKK